MKTSEHHLCQHPGCECSYTTYNNLLKHYRENKSHKPINLERKAQVTAKDSVDLFLGSDLPEKTRLSRIREVIEQISEQDLIRFALPRLCHNVSVWEFVKKKCETRRHTTGSADILQQLKDLKSDILSEFPGLEEIAFGSPTTCSIDKHPVQVTNENEELLCEQILLKDNGKVFREKLMPLVYEREKHIFTEFASGIVSSFGVGQKSLQDILRNTWGKHLAQALGINIIPPKNEVVSSMNAKRSELIEKVGLTIERHGELVVDYVDPKLYLEYFLSRPGTQLSIQTPKGAIIIFAYNDLAPFLKWSRNFNGLTSLRVKIVEPYNLQSTVLSLAYYLDKDSYDNTMRAFSGVYAKLASLKSITHEPSSATLDVHYRCVGDGKERRSSTGNSTARSSYPICDAPEHQSKLGDMTVLSDGPQWTVDDSVENEEEYEKWLGGKKDNDANRNEFAKTHLGLQGRKNVSCCDMDNYYPGTVHLALRTAETLCQRISACATAMHGSPTKWLKAMSKLARHVNYEDGKMTFDEIGVLALPQKLPKILAEAGFTGIVLEVLSCFASGLNTVFKNLLFTPDDGLTSNGYEVDARVNLGFQASVIFGTRSITPSLKQIVTYVPYYIDKAVDDGNLVGLPLTLNNFSDRTMETAHSEPKTGQFRFSGGRTGAITKEDQSELIITQLFYNELMKVESRESESSLVTSDAKHKRRREKEEADPTCTNAKRLKVNLPFDDTPTVDYAESATEESPVEIGSRVEDQDEEVQTENLIMSREGTNIQEGNAENAADLCNQLKQRATIKMPNVTKTDKESAAEFFNTLKQDTSTSSHHLKSVSIANIHWSREDVRVSKEIFVLKVNPSSYKKPPQLVIEHKKFQAEERQRVIIVTSDVMGIELLTNTVVLDVYRCPTMTTKIGRSPWKDEALGVTESGKTNHRITISFLGQTPSSELESVPHLSKAINTGLLPSYPHFTPENSVNPEEYLPVVQDPTLVRAMQLCILDLQNQHPDPVSIVKVFSQLFQAFKDLLSERLSDKESHEE